MAPVETEYYDWVRPLLFATFTGELTLWRQLEVTPDVNDTELKKAYRKQAIKVCAATSHRLETKR